MADGIRKCERPDSPNRCQAVTHNGQCLNEAVVGGNFCRVHGGNKTEEAQKKKALKLYRLSKWRAKVAHFANSPEIKSLREEIGIVRMILEERLNACNSVNDIFTYSSSISNLIDRIEKLVSSCNKIETKLSTTLDKQQILTFTSEVLNIISDEISDADILERIGDRILGTISRGVESDAGKRGISTDV